MSESPVNNTIGASVTVLSNDARAVLNNLRELGRGTSGKRGLLGPSTNTLLLVGTSRPDENILNLARCYQELVICGVVREVSVTAQCSQYLLNEVG